MQPDPLDVQSLRDRDRVAWDALYESTCRRTYRVLFHVTGAIPWVLEELNQEVWLSAMESIDRFDATLGTAQDWILGIARFKGLSHLRRQYSSRMAMVGFPLNPEDPSQSPSDAMEDAERSALLRASIESLPESWQFVLRQKYEKGMSVKEISDLAGSTPKAIESTLSRARQRLRDLFLHTVIESSAHDASQP